MTIPITNQAEPDAGLPPNLPDRPQDGQSTRTREPAFGHDGFNFFDLLDIINPLQHIPVISTIYRHLTGDEISPAARLAGGGLFGGAIGLAYAMFNNISDDATGKDLGEHVMAFFISDGPGLEAGTMLAANEPKANLDAKSDRAMDAPAEAGREPENQARAAERDPAQAPAGGVFRSTLLPPVLLAALLSTNVCSIS